MLDLENIGTYLDRKIMYQKINLLDQYSEKNDLSDTLIAIYFGNNINSIIEIEFFLKKIIEGIPLGIFLAGKKTSEYFDILLHLLSSFNNESHIITNISIDECNWIESFLTATWPVEERFDYWESYTIIEINGSIVKKSVRNFLT